MAKEYDRPGKRQKYFEGGVKQMAVKVTREKNKLRIELPLERAMPSKSGKTLVVASTRGVITTDVKYKGKPVVLVVNAFVYPSDQRHPAKRELGEDKSITE